MGTVWTEICEHGKTTMSGGKHTYACSTCNKHNPNREVFFVPNMTPFFNHGLGVETCGTRDAEKKAKKMGKAAIGDAHIEQVFRKEKVDIKPILIEGMKKLKARHG